MNKWTLGQIGKTKPKQSQYKPNTNPIQTQFKPKQTQFHMILAYFSSRAKNAATFSNKGREVVDKQMLSWYCSARTVPQYFSEVNMENTANDHP